MKKYFRVLILDDDSRVLDRIPERAALCTFSYANDIWQIVDRRVHIDLEKSDDECWKITDKTIKSIADACDKMPNLIIADYGFADPVVRKELKELSTRKEITEDDFRGKVFMLPDLVNIINNRITTNSFSRQEKKSLNKYFANFNSNLYLYTYTSREFKKALGEVETRKNRTGLAFPKAYVIAKDTKYEFYNGDEFDKNDKETKHSSDYYSVLTSNMINQIIEKELYLQVLESAKSYKYLRLPKTAISTSIIVALGGAVGAISSLISDKLIENFKSNIISGIIIFLMFTLAIVIITIIISIFFEKLFKNLLFNEEYEMSQE